MGVLSELYSFKSLIANSDSKILSTGEIALWYALKLFQSENTELINVPGKVLEKCTGLSHKGFYKARENLIQKGFIEYTSDSSINKSGTYKFINSEKVHTETEGNTGTGVKVHTETEGNTGTSEKVHTETEGNTGTSEKVHTETEGNTGTSEKVHTETEGNTGTSEKVHTETEGNTGTREKVHNETEGNTGTSEKVHTETTNFKKLFGAEDDDIIKTNTFNRTSKMFMRMIKNEKDGN